MRISPRHSQLGLSCSENVAKNSEIMNIVNFQRRYTKSSSTNRWLVLAVMERWFQVCLYTSLQVWEQAKFWGCDGFLLELAEKFLCDFCLQASGASFLKSNNAGRYFCWVCACPTCLLHNCTSLQTLCARALHCVSHVLI